MSTQSQEYKTKLIRISSDDKDTVKSQSNSSFLVHLGEKYIPQAALKLQVKSAIVPNNFYNIRSSTGQGDANNTFWLSATNLVPATEFKQYTIPEGQYTSTDLAAELKSLINADPPLAINVTSVSLNTTTGKFEFRINAAIGWTITFIANDGVHISTANQALGYLTNFATTLTVNPQTISLPLLPALNGYSQVYIHSRVGFESSMIEGEGMFSLVTEISFHDVPFGFTGRFQEKDSTLSEIIFTSPRNIKDFYVRLRNVKGDLLDIQTGELVLIIKIFY